MRAADMPVLHEVAAPPGAGSLSLRLPLAGGAAACYGRLQQSAGGAAPTRTSPGGTVSPLGWPWAKPPLALSLALTVSSCDPVPEGCRRPRALGLHDLSLAMRICIRRDSPCRTPPWRAPCIFFLPTPAGMLVLFLSAPFLTFRSSLFLLPSTRGSEGSPARPEMESEPTSAGAPQHARARWQRRRVTPRPSIAVPSLCPK
mmetsp:Transcript_4411/g.14018  ORF Transcript_4411/g.14018 Transcript_4411/m.14018 type:complete len:201 (+) Transcript_4411:648-1250(+)